MLAAAAAVRSIATFSGQKAGTVGNPVCCSSVKTEEEKMPVLLLWAVPAIIVIGGASYYLVHLH
jgi:hypothetical protein